MSGIANKTGYTIHGLNSSTTYNVCVHAMDIHGGTQRNWIHCNSITTTAYGGPGITTGGPGTKSGLGTTGMYFQLMSSVFSGYGWLWVCAQASQTDLKAVRIWCL